MPDFESPFIVESDASNVAVGAFMAQKKKGGKIHAVKYANRMMNSAGRNHYDFEREVLAMIFASRKFRVYLLSKEPVKLIKDHQILRFAFKKCDINGMLASWM